MFSSTVQKYLYASSKQHAKETIDDDLYLKSKFCCQLSCRIKREME